VIKWILENKEKVNKVLEAPDSFELLIFREKFGKSW